MLGHSSPYGCSSQLSQSQIGRPKRDLSSFAARDWERSTADVRSLPWMGPGKMNHKVNLELIGFRDVFSKTKRKGRDG